MNCIVVDDEDISRSVTKQLVSQVELLKLVGLCKSAGEAGEVLKREKVDLIFLDIEMPEINGMDFIRSLDDPPLIILTTSHIKYATDAFEYNVVDYLVKPITPARFLKAVERARELFDTTKFKPIYYEKDYFFIKNNSLMTKVLMKDILWIEALGDYISVHTSDKKFVLRHTLKSIYDRLPPDKFIRVHRSYVVAIDNVTSVEDTTISLHGNMIPIGALYKENFIKLLNLM
jgi:two-component system LytT family response regulator